MDKETLKNNFYNAMIEAFKTIELLQYSDEYPHRVCYAMTLMCGKLMFASEYYILLKQKRYMYSVSNKEMMNLINKQISDYEKINPYLTFDNVISYLKNNNIVYVEYGKDPQRYVVTEEMAILAGITPNSVPFIYFITETGQEPSWFKDCIVYNEKTNFEYQYVIKGVDGFTTKYFEIKPLTVDISLNYNDDIPDKEIKDFIQSDGSGIIIMHGEPGTGKSTYIKHLISTLETDFIYIDSSCFDYLTESSFVELLTESKNSVLILEDSEKLLKKRNNSDSNRLSALLNLTDGLLADVMNLKIICTFNASLGDIDEAILRKGRLKVRYQFDKLSKEKTNILLKNLGIDNPDEDGKTLADIYNYAEQVDFSKTRRKSIGFG